MDDTILADRNGMAFDLRWARTVEPVIEPLTMQDAKDHLRISQSDGDAFVYRSIRAAREAAEAALNRGILTQTWRLTLRRFADVIWLPMAAPLQSVTSIQYYDTTGSLQTLSTSVYGADVEARPGRVVRAANQAWPSLQADRLAGSVMITYVVGWTSADLVPDRIKQGMRLYLGWLDADRDGLDANSSNARNAALSCWDDRVEVIQPQAARWPV